MTISSTARPDAVQHGRRVSPAAQAADALLFFVSS